MCLFRLIRFSSKNFDLKQLSKAFYLTLPCLREIIFIRKVFIIYYGQKFTKVRNEWGVRWKGRFIYKSDPCWLTSTFNGPLVVNRVCDLKMNWSFRGLILMRSINMRFSYWKVYRSNSRKLFIELFSGSSWIIFRHSSDYWTKIVRWKHRLSSKFLLSVSKFEYVLN